MHCDTCGSDEHSTKGHARKDRKLAALLPPAPKPKPTRRARRPKDSALDRWARNVYDYDRDFGGPEFE